MKHLLIGLLILLSACSSTKRASYYNAQLAIERGDFSFADDLRVDEYLNAFDQPQIPSPKNKDAHLDIQFFHKNLSKSQSSTLAQIAIRTRKPTPEEESKKIALSIVLDISGSMADGMLEDAKTALIDATRELRNGTELSIVLFDDDAELLLPKTTISKDNKLSIIEKIKKIGVDGGTNIEAGLVLGYKQMASFSHDAISRLILITDGQSNVGVTNPNEIAKKARVNYLEGARISTVGLGGGVDERLLRKIADQGKGHYYFADKATTLAKFLREDIRSTLIPALKDATIVVESHDGFKIKSVYGYEQYVKSETRAEIPFSELNVDDWRILITEVTGQTMSSKVSPLTATLRYTTTNNLKEAITLSPSIAVKGKPGTVNPSVARNSVLLSNALALKAIAKLNAEGKKQEALDLTDLQLTNIQLAKAYDDSEMFANEEKTFLKIQKTLRANPSEEIKPVKTQNNLLKDGLGLVKRVLPGPWGLIISLFELAL